MSFPTLIRTASEQGLLLNGWDRWSEFRRARNETSQTHSEQIALEVLEELPAFLVEAQHLLRTLNERAS